MYSRLKLKKRAPYTMFLAVNGKANQIPPRLLAQESSSADLVVDHVLRNTKIKASYVKSSKAFATKCAKQKFCMLLSTRGNFTSGEWTMLHDTMELNRKVCYPSPTSASAPPQPYALLPHVHWLSLILSLMSHLAPSRLPLYG